MTKPVRKFARVYYDDLQREFPEVWADDALLATWLRLLVVAEKHWPTLPEVPRSVRPRALARLASTGLVLLTDPHCYRIRGLDAERTRRQDAARNAAGKRWDSDSNAEGNASAMPRQDETRKDELPPLPRKRGLRKDGTNPRANGTAPRQKREAEKRAGIPTSVAAILSRAAAEGRS